MVSLGYTVLGLFNEYVRNSDDTSHMMPLLCDDLGDATTLEIQQLSHNNRITVDTKLSGTLEQP